MESNGKHVPLDGANVDLRDGPIFWGEPGRTPALPSTADHQGTRLIRRLHRLHAHSRETRICGDHRDVMSTSIGSRVPPKRSAFGEERR